MIDQLLSSDYVQTMIAPEMQAELTKYALVLGIMWKMMGKTSEHGTTMGDDEVENESKKESSRLGASRPTASDKQTIRRGNV